MFVYQRVELVSISCLFLQLTSLAKCSYFHGPEVDVSARLEVEQKAQLAAAKSAWAMEPAPVDFYRDREAELQTLRLQKEEVLAQVSKKDAVQASLSQELRKTKQQLQQSEHQKQKLLTSLQDGLLQGAWGTW
eukprot:s3835_g1.t1